MRIFQSAIFRREVRTSRFKRPDLIERMNDIIAKHYPGMLASG
jgi:hypothetical protein